ncbi:DNA excision repair protein ERCC-8-like [Ruditapes philippinarum]|uniref:DNA excision repair protein ERCC-8-like n=1 Tax=Ruditapes philippinarum TaxID=129788 RepID=UPI00295C2596|nr:DNA excision repair protein ERCC-8-like [Ruditapes philippinarum]
MLRFLNSRESGVSDPIQFYRAETTRRVFNLGLSENKEFERLFAGNINTLDVDLIESRYLLAGGAEGFIMIYDVYNNTGNVKYKCNSVGTIALNSRHRHKFSVETVLWYPLDTGMFTSSGTDNLLKIWDTNRLKPADQYEFSSVVFNHHMSPIATKHCLIAVATQSSSVKLVDLKSGSATHSLKGHSKGVFNVKWSPYHEFVLASAGSDNRIFLWDIRNAKGSMLDFDQYNGRPPKDMINNGLTSHNRPVTGVQFSSDGLRLVSCGLDNKAHIWCTQTGKNLNLDFSVNSMGTRTSQFAISQGSAPDLIFMPNGKSIDAFDLNTGKRQYTLHGHFRQVTCCYYHADFHELYSGSGDRNILVWEAKTGTSVNYVCKKETKSVKQEPGSELLVTNMEPVTAIQATADSWSSDEET